jgi:serine/threonine-protein kinase HipA
MAKIAALNVSYNNESCGYLAQYCDSSCNRVYMYVYTKAYLAQNNAKAISQSLPLREDPYYSEHLFGFFDNLLSEGWDVSRSNKN